MLWSRWNPFRSPVQVPNQADIQSRLAYVSCVGQLGTVKAADYCDYIRPPIDRYGTLQFGAFDEIRDVGYHHGKTYFAGMRKAGLMRQFLQGQQQQQQPGEGRYFSLSSALRKGNLDGGGVLSSSLESQASLSAGRSPVKMPLDNWADMVETMNKVESDDQVIDDDDDDVASDQLLSDEEDDDGESGFLSQM